jgi:hypothetical protein
MEVNKKDKRIQILFDVVQAKRDEISKAEKPTWQTNLAFGYNEDSSARTNLNVVTKAEDFVKMLSFLIDRQSSHVEACKELGVEIDFTWLGFTFADWKSDIKTRFNKVQITEKKKELDTLEKQLDKLVSPEMKEELELIAIEKSLGL